MAKGTMKSMRLSDEIIELIEKQKGNTFTDKFENLVVTCIEKLPNVQRELKHTQDEIVKEREVLRDLYGLRTRLQGDIRNLCFSLENLNNQVSRVSSSLVDLEGGVSDAG